MDAARRKKTIAIATLIVVVVVIGFCVYGIRRFYMRLQVEHWVHEPGWKKDMGYFEQMARQREALLALGPATVNLLINDLEPSAAMDAFGERLRWLFPKSTRLRAVLANRHQKIANRRFEAVKALSLMGYNAAPAVPALLRTLPNSPPSVAQELVTALGFAGVASPEVMEALTQARNTPPILGVVSRAAVALWQLAPTNQSYVAYINGLLRDPDHSTAGAPGRIGAIYIAYSLELIGGPANGFAPALEQGLFKMMERSKISVDGKTIYARALWRLTGSPEAALNLFSNWNSRYTSSSLPSSEHPLVRMALPLQEIPEFCAAALPLLREVNKNYTAEAALDGAQLALTRLERTLRLDTNALYPRSATP